MGHRGVSDVGPVEEADRVHDQAGRDLVFPHLVAARGAQPRCESDARRRAPTHSANAFLTAAAHQLRRRATTDSLLESRAAAVMTAVAAMMPVLTSDAALLMFLPQTLSPHLFPRFNEPAM
jgi:hypothetical protein